MYDKKRNNRLNVKHDLLKETNLTYRDYASLDDGNRYELAGGQLELMSPAPTVTHQMISFEMQRKMASSCEEDYIILYSPIDLILADNEVRQPDLVLVDRKRMHIIKNRGIEGPPDLVVEILSPSTLKRDKIDKRNIYASFSIPEYWVVEPKTGILEQYLLHSEQYNLNDIFQDDEEILSPNISCVSFTMNCIMENIPELEK